MKILKPYIVILIALLLFSSYSYSRTNEIEERLIHTGLIDIHTIDPSIKVDLVNSYPDKNFFRKDYYNGLNKAYLQKEVADKLSIAQNYLKSEFPEYSLLVMDAARPRSISKLMYEKMKGTKFEKYVANPNKGSMHNYGVAVDVTIMDANGKEIDMGFSPFYKNDISIYLGYMKYKTLGMSKQQKTNRNLLSRVMKRAGFFPLSYEWWHYENITKEAAREKYQVIE